MPRPWRSRQTSLVANTRCAFAFAKTYTSRRYSGCFRARGAEHVATPSGRAPGGGCGVGPCQAARHRGRHRTWPEKPTSRERPARMGFCHFWMSLRVGAGTYSWQYSSACARDAIPTMSRVGVFGYNKMPYCQSSVAGVPALPGTHPQWHAFLCGPVREVLCLAHSPATRVHGGPQVYSPKVLGRHSNVAIRTIQATWPHRHTGPSATPEPAQARQPTRFPSTGQQARGHQSHV